MAGMLSFILIASRLKPSACLEGTFCMSTLMPLHAGARRGAGGARPRGAMLQPGARQLAVVLRHPALLPGPIPAAVLQRGASPLPAHRSMLAVILAEHGLKLPAQVQPVWRPPATRLSAGPALQIHMSTVMPQPNFATESQPILCSRRSSNGGWWGGSRCLRKRPPMSCARSSRSCALCFQVSLARKQRIISGYLDPLSNLRQVEYGSLSA